MEYAPLFMLVIGGLNLVVMTVLLPLVLRLRDLKDQQLERIEQRVVSLENKMDSHMLLHLNIQKGMAP